MQEADTPVEEAALPAEAAMQEADTPAEEAALPAEAAVEPNTTTTEAAGPTTGNPATTKKVVYFPGVACPACDTANLPLKLFNRYDALVRHWRERHFPVTRVFPCPSQDCRYTSRRSHDTHVHLLNQHCGGERGERFRRKMKLAQPANIKNSNFVDPTPYYLPLTEPPKVGTAKRSVEEVPRETPPAKPAAQPKAKPAVEPQTPDIPPVPEGKQDLLKFIQTGHQAVDTWTSAVREASSRLHKLEEEQRRQADQALRQRTRQLDEERRRVGNLRSQIDLDDCTLSPLSRWSRPRWM